MIVDGHIYGCEGGTDVEGIDDEEEDKVGQLEVEAHHSWLEYSVKPCGFAGMSPPLLILTRG